MKIPQDLCQHVDAHSVIDFPYGISQGLTDFKEEAYFVGNVQLVVVTYDECEKRH